MKLNARIRFARRRAKLTQAELATLLTVGRSAVANWECTNDTSPSTQRLAAVAAVTQVSFEWLATGRGQPSFDELDSIPAVDALLVDDPAERQLVEAYRSCSAPVRQVLFQFIESQQARRGGHPGKL